MAGDADMDQDEMVARIALLEAMVVKLLEIEARRLSKDGGKPALDGLLYSLGEAATYRTQSMKEEQKLHVDRLLALWGRALLSALEPDDRGRN